MNKIAFLIIALLLALPLIVLALGRERVLAGLFGEIEVRPIDFRTLALTPDPNQYLVCPPGYCAATAHAESPVFDLSAEDLRQRWNAMLSRQPRIEVVSADDQAQQYTVIQRSRLLRFPDSITVKFIALPDNRSTLALYSRSHYGKSDLGVNMSRGEAWLKALTAP